MTKRLVVQLRADGSVAAETFGMYGDDCLPYINALEDLLDATTVSSSFTDDYSRVAAQSIATEHITERER